jgi:glycosyltransferase involved in cell wall biosynthesis
MKISIITTGRFHVASLGRELGKLGHDVTLYSYVPKFKAKDFHLNQINHKSYFWFLLPFILGGRIKNLLIANFFNKYLFLVYDFILSKFVNECEVLIFMSGCFVKTPIAVKSKYGANIVIERGSTHIITQTRILSEILDYNPTPDFFIKREIIGYEIADLISVPADHTKQSFIDNGVSDDKIIQNPYGVSLDAFSMTPFNEEIKPTVIMVGNWCLRKGADLILKTMELLPGFNFLHVGAITDVEFPFHHPQFTHIEPVSENALVEYYAKAHVFLLPSREEGLALVQLQALACGLPVVHTYRTGASDLKRYITNKEMIITVTEEPLEIKQAIEHAFHYRIANKDKNSLNQDDRSKISWSAYGKRYEANLLNRFGKP